MYSQLLCATLGLLAADRVVAFLAVTPLSDLRVVSSEESPAQLPPPAAEDETEDAAADLFLDTVPEDGGEGGPEVLPLVTGRGDPTTETFVLIRRVERHHDS